MSSSLGYSAVSGPAGPLMMLKYNPSVLGTLKLDGKGNYRTARSQGRYSVDAATGRFIFVSGGLKGWPAVYEVVRGTPVVRLARKQDAEVGAKSRVGEHTCRRRGSEKFTDIDAPKTSDGTGRRVTGKPNLGFKGTLTFREEWGSNSIVDVDLTTGKVQSRFEGREAFRARNGETVFVNKQGELVIAGAKGVPTTKVPLSLKEGVKVDMPVLAPDGSKVAFHYQPIYYDSRVIVTDRSGKVLAEFKGVTEPDWTPDGRLIVSNSLETQGAKAAISLSDAGLTRLTRIDPNLDSVRAPAVSPDGKRVAFIQHGHIWVIGIDGKGLKQLTKTDGGEERPVWSPDGQALAFATKKYNQVRLVSLATGKITEVHKQDGGTMQCSGRLTWR
jgi:dipeptidyl aminopeptidase/acylaminoacyl peptidase